MLQGKQDKERYLWLWHLVAKVEIFVDDVFNSLIEMRWDWDEIQSQEQKLSHFTSDRRIFQAKWQAHPSVISLDLGWYKFFYKLQCELVKIIMMKLPHIERVEYFSDGCAAKYKNYKNMLNIRLHERISLLMQHGPFLQQTTENLLTMEKVAQWND